MPQLFSRSADTIFRTALVGGFVLVNIAVGSLLAVVRSPYITDQHLRLDQPVPFSHQHHVGDVGLDCRYCHQTVETSAIAGVPPTQVCMNCHRQLWNQSEMLEPVRASWRNNLPLTWNRVHDLPDFVYFNHSIHIHKGIGCYSCHGRVNEMPLIEREKPLTMQWCLDCHRDPEKHVRPRSLVFDTKPLEELLSTPAFRQAASKAHVSSSTEPAQNSTETLSQTQLAAVRKSLADEYQLESRTTCFTCHR